MESNNSIPEAGAPQNQPLNPVPVVPQPSYQAPQQATAIPTQGLEGPFSLLKSSWAFFTTNWKVIVPIVVMPSVLIYLGQLLIVTKDPFISILAVISIIVGAIFSVAMYPAAIDAIHRISLGTGTGLTFNGQYKLGFSIFWSILLLMIMQGFVVFGSFTLLFIPGVIVSVYVSMYIFVRVLEGKKGFSAFTESCYLIKDRWMKIFGRFLFLIVVYIIPMILIAIIGSVYKTGQTGAVYSFMVNIASAAIISPLTLIYMYRLYMDLKRTRQGVVSTVGFKNWLISFMIIGIIAPILIASVALLGFISMVGNSVTQIGQQGIDINTLK